MAADSGQAPEELLEELVRDVPPGSGAWSVSPTGPRAGPGAIREGRCVRLR